MPNSTASPIQFSPATLDDLVGMAVEQADQENAIRLKMRAALHADNVPEVLRLSTLWADPTGVYRDQSASYN